MVLVVVQRLETLSHLLRYFVIPLQNYFLLRMNPFIKVDTNFTVAVQSPARLPWRFDWDWAPPVGRLWYIS